ncbi:hypothetical protein [Pedobacter alluvionis]|uniref:Uncharacterized protein n=1 Tax=Pedobacter alluvionis TaxID=475253 RepID=A0A497YE57_9SPHI|nr:hypothetical protein [Pedobacter alluvionis]RLJ80816.1 hypothetical protein BCL90_1617 [Pedobacter alluvionis]TFB32056.1 hypothetical protein E3V97_15975 [Pedobacter alluvionis]
MNDNIEPRDNDAEDSKGQSQVSPNEEKEVDDNEVQRGLTGETDDEEDVGGDIAGNAGGNT